jgi:carbamoyl-phosphate synthase small subunit
VNARVILEDGKSFEGISFGKRGYVVGEIAAHNTMTGFQQLITEPANAGLILSLSFPLIGNVGTNREDVESSRSCLKGLIVREHCLLPSNFRCEKNFDTYLKEEGVVGISGIDTRALNRHIHRSGPLKGAILTGDHPVEEVVSQLRNMDDREGRHSSAGVGVGEEYLSRIRDIVPPVDLVVIDLGLRLSLLRALKAEGFRTVVVPGETSPETVIGLRPRTVIVAGGPGDPADVAASIVEGVSALIGAVPLLGISLGAQVLALAMGAATVRLWPEHRGEGYPIREVATGRIYITSQNRGYTIDRDSLPPTATITHFNLHDGVVEGFRHVSAPAWGFEFWPYYSHTKRAFASVFSGVFGEALSAGGVFDRKG